MSCSINQWGAFFWKAGSLVAIRVKISVIKFPSRCRVSWNLKYSLPIWYSISRVISFFGSPVGADADTIRTSTPSINFNFSSSASLLKRISRFPSPVTSKRWTMLTVFETGSSIVNITSAAWAKHAKRLKIRITKYSLIPLYISAKLDSFLSVSYWDTWTLGGVD